MTPIRFGKILAWLGWTPPLFLPFLNPDTNAIIRRGRTVLECRRVHNTDFGLPHRRHYIEKTAQSQPHLDHQGPNLAEEISVWANSYLLIYSLYREKRRVNLQFTPRKAKLIIRESCRSNFTHLVESTDHSCFSISEHVYTFYDYYFIF